MVLAILSLGTSKRRWEYSQAMVLPFASTIVDTAGTSPSRSCAEPLATTSEARLEISPSSTGQREHERGGDDAGQKTASGELENREGCPGTV